MLTGVRSAAWGDVEGGLPCVGIPDTDTGIQATCSNLLTIECNSVYLTKMTCQRP